MHAHANRQLVFARFRLALDPCRSESPWHFFANTNLIQSRLSDITNIYE